MKLETATELFLNHQRRRQFIKKSTLALLAMSSAPWVRSQHAISPDWPVAIFEKIFEGLSFKELADAVHQIGADGIEATIRPGGHIEPEKAVDEVPAMAEALSQKGKKILIAATHIRRVDEEYTEPLLKIFKQTGIRYYRMGHYYLDHAKPMLEQVRDYAAQARDLAVMNREYGIQGLYQNHAGARYLGALGWDTAMMLEGIDADDLGVALDLRHLKADSGSSWKTMAQALKPSIRSIYVKDGRWIGERGNKLKNVPLDTGFVTQDVFDYVKDGLDPMPLCLHVEHLGYRVFEKHEIPGAIRGHQKDLDVLKHWMQ